LARLLASQRHAGCGHIEGCSWLARSLHTHLHTFRHTLHTRHTLHARHTGPLHLAGEWECFGRTALASLAFAFHLFLTGTRLYARLAFAGRFKHYHNNKKDDHTQYDAEKCPEVPGEHIQK